MVKTKKNFHNLKTDHIKSTCINQPKVASKVERKLKNTNKLLINSNFDFFEQKSRSNIGINLRSNGRSNLRYASKPSSKDRTIRIELLKPIFSTQKYCAMQVLNSNNDSLESLHSSKVPKEGLNLYPRQLRLKQSSNFKLDKKKLPKITKLGASKFDLSLPKGLHNIPMASQSRRPAFQFKRINNRRKSEFASRKDMDKILQGTPIQQLSESRIRKDHSLMKVIYCVILQRSIKLTQNGLQKRMNLKHSLANTSRVKRIEQLTQKVNKILNYKMPRGVFSDENNGFANENKNNSHMLSEFYLKTPKQSQDFMLRRNNLSPHGNNSMITPLKHSQRTPAFVKRRGSLIFCGEVPMNPQKSRLLNMSEASPIHPDASKDL
ncbi:unnamed protein product [Moneuplotes crassus]|uniref:Uncharacterized protein n=1 Tax=Euplotes crassus TaxID=5936 RepID=A0AAD1UJ27_EUPCR|nr:unnamed protein product [Moneuplotes crassus]